MCSGCKSYEKHASLRITKARIRLSPILLIGESSYFLARNLLPPADEAWTETAGNDLRLEGLELVHDVSKQDDELV
ncbi:MAG: hypothetical protein HW412_2354 [Bacteroidetes bacterium]|nr:hypothetical protein [Bacteroidota bacterium]